MQPQNLEDRAWLLRLALGEEPKSSAATLPEPEPVLTEKPRETPTPEPQPVPERVPERARVIQPGCCPVCGASSPLYERAPSAINDRDMQCRQCGFRTKRAQIEANGNRIFSREPEVFEPAGISRAQWDDYEWRSTHVQKERGEMGRV